MQQQEQLKTIENVSDETSEVIDTFGVEELEQRYEYDTNITICHYEWH